MCWFFSLNSLVTFNLLMYAVKTSLRMTEFLLFLLWMLCYAVFSMIRKGQHCFLAISKGILSTIGRLFFDLCFPYLEDKSVLRNVCLLSLSQSELTYFLMLTKLFLGNWRICRFMIVFNSSYLTTITFFLTFLFVFKFYFCFCCCGTLSLNESLDRSKAGCLRKSRMKILPKIHIFETNHNGMVKLKPCHIEFCKENEI